MKMYVTDKGTQKENLVVITHGWKGSADDLWVKELQSSIAGKTDAAKTSVRTFDWKKSAGTGDPVTGGGPWQAFINAGDEGKCLAEQILGLKPMSANVHLIAHSAGSNVIQTAVYEIARHYNFKPDTGAPFLHLTFLDAFAPAMENSNYGELYGLKGYAEQYVDTRLVASINSVDGTDDFHAI